MASPRPTFPLHYTPAPAFPMRWHLQLKYGLVFTGSCCQLHVLCTNVLWRLILLGTRYVWFSHRGLVDVCVRSCMHMLQCVCGELCVVVLATSR